MSSSPAPRTRELNPRLLGAYRRTEYRAGAAAVRVGRPSVAVQALLRRHRAREATFLTAWNPMSRRMPPGWNERMQRSLVQRLGARAVLRGEGVGRGWREEHLLVFGPARRGIVLGRLYRQRAVVVIRPDGRAKLVLL